MWFWPCVAAAATLVATVVMRVARRRRRRTQRAAILLVGGARGIGRHTARSLVARGDRVVITSRSAASAMEAARLEGCVGGVQCDVCDAASIERALTEARALLGAVEVVVAMQGRTQEQSSTLRDVPHDQLASIVSTNLTGTMLLAQAALRATDVRHFVLVGGGGTAGNATANYAAYGATKAGLGQLFRSLLAEEKRVGIHLLVPGMALTQLLMGGPDCRTKDARTRRVFNVLAETEATMGEWFADQLQCLRPTGTYESFLTRAQVLWRFARYPLMRDRLVEETTGLLRSK